MANCSENFFGKSDSLIKAITIYPDKKKQLRTSRNALRDKIRKFLSEKNTKSVKFYQQGSYAHKTLLNPLNGDFDIDDGVYMDLSDFETEPAPATIHSWIKEAAKGHTEQEPIDKDPCVRIPFKAGYHVDMPAYKFEVDDDGNESYFLAKKSVGWEPSHPRAMTNWFEDQIREKSEQLKRNVIYFKGWRDYRNTKIDSKLPNGLTLTILACEEYVPDPRDDISFLHTGQAILNRLVDNDEIWKPYEPTENMRNYLSQPQFEKFLDELTRIHDYGGRAIELEDMEEAARQWRKLFGDRFPIYKDPNDDDKSHAKSFTSPAVIGTTVRSA